MTYDDDRALDQQEANADAAIARESAERAAWLHANDYWLRKEFAEWHADLFAAYQQQQWAEYIGEEA
jgi:hypothetical protein